MDTFLERLDELHASLAAMLGLSNELRPSRVALALCEALGPRAVFVGDVCASAHGFIHAPSVLDIAADMTPGEALEAIQQAGASAEAEKNVGDYPWAVSGDLGGILIHIVPADHLGVDPVRGQDVEGIRVASVEDYITSRCAMGGRADMHDAAVLVLIRTELRPYAEAQAATYLRSAYLDEWLNDSRLLARWQPGATRALNADPGMQP